MRNHTVFPATRHRWTLQTSAEQDSTRFIYPGGIEDWVSRLVI